MSVGIMGVHHIAMKACGTEHFNKVVDFYQNILGLPVVRSWGEGKGAGIMLDTGAGLLEIFADGPEDMDQGAIRHFAFDVKDTDACVEAVRAAGYQITEEPHDIVIPSEPPYPARIAFCIGAAGEEIEFFQVK